MAASEIRLKVQSPDEARRLDAFLAKIPQVPSRSHALRLLGQDCVKVNGRSVKPSYSLRANDEIVVSFPESKASALAPEDIPLSVLYEDTDLLVINKPRGLVVHPGAGHEQGTLTQALLHHCGKLSSIGGVERPGIVHRLDKGTSGVMVVAKNDKSHQALARQFKEHSVVKHYLALVYGRLSPLEQTIENKIARNDRNRKKFTVHPHKGKIAVSKYKVMRQNERFTLADIQIFTGRTHQIRVHMSHKACPIVGDLVYGQRKKFKNMPADQDACLDELKEPLLHALHLSFTHPRSGQRLDFKAPLPPEFEAALQLFIP